MKVLPEPSIAHGSLTRVPLMGQPHTCARRCSGWHGSAAALGPAARRACPPPFSSHPATIMAAMRLFLLL